MFTLHQTKATVKTYDKICQYCSKDFQAKTDRGKNCSRYCAWKMRGGNHHTVKCASCLQYFITTIINETACSRECKLERSRLRLKKYPTEWLELREFIIKRDGFECCLCNSIQQLCLHHIKFLKDGGSNDKLNLVTMCNSCHATLHKASPEKQNMMTDKLLKKVS